MDEIEYKLKSQNPALISHAIYKLIEMIQKKLEVEKDISKITQFKLLSTKCSSDDFIVNTSACQALVILVENKLCDIKTVLAIFMSSLSTSRNNQAITMAVSRLLILDCKAYNKCSEYTLQIPTQHPFITILNGDKHSWRSVLIQIRFIMHNGDKQFVERSIELLRPVFLYILCNPSTGLSDSCKRDAWELVIKSSYASDLQAEILLWMCTNHKHICVDTHSRVFELAEVSLQKEDKEYCTALIPLIASLAIQLLEYGHEPTQNFWTILNLFKQGCYNDTIGDITIILMAEIILICPVAYLPDAFEICAIIVDKTQCDIVLLNALSASLLKWLTYPSLLSSKTLVLAKELINKIILRKQTSDGSNAVPKASRILLMLSHSNRHIRFYTELVYGLLSSIECDTAVWLENFSLAPIDVRYMCKLVLCGIFLYSDVPLFVQKTCRILVQMAMEINAFASHMLSLLMYKLTKSHDSSTLECLLLAVPEFAMFKENLPIVVHTLDTLLNSGKPSSKYFAIQLYTKAVEKEPRCYRFMSDALMNTMEQDRSWPSVVSCARAIKHVCESRPELSQELVPLLSQILNQCVDLNGGAATALALNSISALCKFSVIGICSTWKILAPKMRKEKRTVVLENLCELFADVPSYPSQSSDDYENFVTDVVTLLWSYVVREDARVAESALKALKSYHIAQIPLSALPLTFRSHVVLPNTYSHKLTNEATKPEDILQYVPGICWIQMLKKVNKSVLTAAGDLLISYIEEELNTFRSRIYNWPRGEPHDFKYLPDRSVIRAIGEYLRRDDKSDPNNHKVMVECLRIFDHKYTKPLPNIKWDFLKEAMQISEKAKKYCLSIASRHSWISDSARSLVESFLSIYKNKFVSDMDQLLFKENHGVFYANLYELCRAIESNDLKPFLEISLDYVIDKILLNDEKANSYFNYIMSSYIVALKSDAIYLENRVLLYSMLAKIFNKVDLTSKHFETYFATVMELSVEEVEKMISLDSWCEVMPEKLRNAIAVSAELALGNFTNTALTWLNEPISVVASNPTIEAREYLLESVQRVQTGMKLEKHCIDWIFDFMSRIDALMVESSHKENNIVFYCDILFISVICLSGMDYLLPKKESLIASQDTRIKMFPQAISMLADRQIWKSTTRQIMNWLNYMRTSSVPDEYRSAFQSSLILLRHEEDYNSEWTNYLSVRTYIYD